MSGFLAFLILFGVVVFVHELGHFAVGKLARVRVDEFGFGYPPRLFTLGTWGGTAYTINAIPIGGFVKMGEEDDSRPDSMANQRWPVRAAAFLAGPLMNLFLAALCYLVIAMFGQQVYSGRVVIEQIAPNSPAQAAGLQVGDQIIAVNEVEVGNTLELSQRVGLSVGTETRLLIERQGQRLSVVLVPRVDPPEGEGAMGVGVALSNIEVTTVRYPLGEAIPQSVRRTVSTVTALVEGLVGMIAGRVPAEVTGPVGLYQFTGEVAKTGWANLMDLAALVSINLFILNLMPFPPLDGFRLLLILVELLRGGRRVTPHLEGVVNAVGMIILLALMLLISYQDVVRLISGQPLLP